MLLFLVQSVLVKLVGVFSQIVLAWYLHPKDFGLIGLAFTFIILPGAIQESGMRETLLKRSKRFDSWATPVYWYMFSISLACAVILAISTPFIVKFYSAPEIRGLLWIFSGCILLNGLCIVPEARLQRDLKFKFLSINGTIVTVAQAVATIILANRGAGAYSIAAPMLVVALVRAIIFTFASGLRIKLKPQFRYWKYFSGNSVNMILTSVLTTVIWQGDYIMLGRFHSKQEVGIYYFAFNLSTQAMMLITNSAYSVLLPTLSRLRERPKEVVNDFLRIERMMALIGVPLCLAQAAVAQPLLQSLFAPKWHNAAPILAILSVGMLFRMVEWPSEVFLKAHGQFRNLLLITIINASSFLLVVGIAAAFGGILQVSLAVISCLILFCPLRIYTAISSLGGNWRQIAGIFIVPLLIGFDSFGVAFIVSENIPSGSVRNLLRIACILILGGGTYILLARKLCESTWNDVADKVNSALGGKFRRKSKSLSPASSGM